MRKACRRRHLVPMPPRAFRPRLDQSQLRDLSLAHHANLDAIATGDVNEVTLWHAVEAALTWSRTATLLRKYEAAMAQQLSMITDLVTRYGRTGSILFTGPEYQLAKLGVQVMDELAAVVDAPTAVAAAQWSRDRINHLRQFHRAKAA